MKVIKTYLLLKLKDSRKYSQGQHSQEMHSPCWLVELLVGIIPVIDPHCHQIEKGDVLYVLPIPCLILIFCLNGVYLKGIVVVGIRIAIFVPTSLSSHSTKISSIRDHHPTPSPIHQLSIKGISIVAQGQCLVAPIVSRVLSQPIISHKCMEMVIKATNSTASIKRVVVRANLTIIGTKDSHSSIVGRNW